ncbi:MAG TPA: hypothetical protein VD866_29100 [Urbifossiella sp.]|nr:hypothetical protein [Urbifossiella sp.]
MTGSIAARFPRVVCGFVVACGSVLLLGCGSQSATPVVHQEPPKAEPEPAIKLTAAAFEAECVQDEAAAQKKYKGKVVELSGTVKLVFYDADFKAVVVALKPASDKNSLGTGLRIDDPAVYGGLGIGQTVVVRGKVDNTRAPGWLLNCVVVEKGADTIIRVNATDLAKENTANADATRAKYTEKTLVVTGTVVAFKMSDVNQVEYLELKGDGNTVITLRYPFSVRTLKQDLQVGQTVRLAGWMISARGKEVDIRDAYPTPEQPK